MTLVYICLALLAAIAGVCSVLVIKVGQARRASRSPNCYYCGSQALRVSSPKGPVDRLLAYWDCVPHRCEVCFNRQHRLAERRANHN